MFTIDFTSWGSHKKTLISFVISALGSLLPTLLIMLVFNFINSATDTYYYLKNGEFYLYSTAILTQGAYILNEEKVKSYDLLSIFFWSSIIVIVVSSVLYVLTLLKTLGIGNYNINKSLLISTSFYFLAFSFLILYFSSYVLNLKIDLSGGGNRKSIENIKNQLK